jgi:cytochrome o ubiquinol oxidase subunit 1
MGALITVFGFAFVWHIWWLVAASLIGTIVVFVAHAARDDQGYMVPAEEVARIEGERMKALGLATGSPVGARVESFERV